jgi:DNA repair protein RadA/Sms
LKALGNVKTAYVSGEESAEQVKDRAERINIDLKNITFSSENQIEGIIKGVDKAVDVIVIDSIQTVYSKNVDSPLGSVSQVKEVCSTLIEFAKTNNVCVIIIGHVTKEGDIAGPKTLEHLVDCVLYFEGEKVSYFRILRAYKNRFGPTDEVGIFEMNETGLIEVTNPAVFLEGSEKAVGRATVGVMEGTRALFFEVQALVVPTTLSVPRRVVKGVDYNKVQLILAVLRKNLNVSLDSYDIYINVVGGISIKSTASDLGIAASVVSSLKNIAIGKGTVFTGEIGLLGEIRGIMYQDKIIKEAKRFGLDSVISSVTIKSIKDIQKTLN